MPILFGDARFGRFSRSVERARERLFKKLSELPLESGSMGFFDYSLTEPTEDNMGFNSGFKVVAQCLSSSCLDGQQCVAVDITSQLPAMTRDADRITSFLGTLLRFARKNLQLKTKEARLFSRDIARIRTSFDSNVANAPSSLLRSQFTSR
jgi:hypothetical protein